MKNNFLDHEAVKRLMDDYFTAVYQADVRKLKTIFHEKAAMYGCLGPNILAGTPQPFYNDLNSQPSMAESSTDCRAVIKQLDVCGSIAKVTLYVDGFYGSATVQDDFHLLKENNEWRIVCKTFTTID